MRLHHSLALMMSLVSCPVWAGDLAFVTCQNGDALSVIDIDAGIEIARWDVPGKPAGVAVTDGAVYTVAADSKTVRRHDPATGTVMAEITLDGGPIGVMIDAPRGHLFVSDWYNARIWMLDAKTLYLIAVLVTGAAPAGLDISPDGRLLAAADRDADQISLFDAETLALQARITVGTRPFGLRFAPDGRLFVGNVGTNDVSVIDPATGQVTATLPVGDRPYGVAFAAERVFVTNQYASTVSAFDLATLTPLITLDTGEYPEGIDATTGGRAIVVAEWFDNTVTVIDPVTLSVTNSIETCDGPRAFGAFLLGEKE